MTSVGNKEVLIIGEDDSVMKGIVVIIFFFDSRIKNFEKHKFG